MQSTSRSSSVPPRDRQRPDVEPQEMLAALWHEAREHRAAIHRNLHMDRCDLRVSTSSGSWNSAGPIRLDGQCACRDFLVDVITECHDRLADWPGELRNPLGAARVHLRLRAAPDWIRQRRVAMGAQARTDRIRNGAQARRLPDEFHRALLEYLVDEAGSMAPLDSQDDLIHRLAARCAREFGDRPEDYLARVADGVAIVERHCRSGRRVNVGTAEQPEKVSWWECYIERPLGRRPRRAVRPISAVPGECGTEADLLTGHGHVEPGDAESAEADTTVIAVLVDAFRRQPDTPAAALRAGIANLVAHGLLADRTAEVLLADRSRLALAARELSVISRRFAP